MTTRSGEKLGWVLGWSGGFVWVLILSVIVLAQGEPERAALGLAILGAAVTSILLFAPWRYPAVSYRRLMTPIYILFFTAVAWGVWALGDARQMGITGWWSASLLLPLTIPLWVLGGRRWQDGDV
jgi:phosphatidylserine synthase